MGCEQIEDTVPVIHFYCVPPKSFQIMTALLNGSETTLGLAIKFNAHDLLRLLNKEFHSLTCSCSDLENNVIR